MKSLVELLELLVLDCARKSDAPVRRDITTLRERVEHEGDSFITITLPRFCQDFERSLDEGRVGPGMFLSFGKTHSGIPEFLQGFLSNVFDDAGALLLEPSVDCIRSVRQICLFGKKILRPCSDERVADATEKFIKCDNEVASPDSTLYDAFKEVAALIFESAESLQGPAVMAGIVPKHGPGATREHISGNQKWVFKRWHHRLERAGFTYHEFGTPGSQAATLFWDSDGVLHVSDSGPVFVEPEDEEPVRVVFVPKTQKSPRVIAVEPVCMQYAQQGLSQLLVRFLERNRFTGGHVNFTDQSVNQALAKGASCHGQLATLDMSDASDRVGLTHVIDLLDKVPDFRKLVMACRSTRAELPNGDIVTLKKFASMGSALCFPIEALVFFTSIIACRIRRAKAPVSARSVYEFGRDVYVYGDDLVVPADEASVICADLEALGFKVNRQKSFWTGKFRESCGMDVYDNSEVTPVYFRRDVPTDEGDVSGILSAVSTANQLYSARLWETAAALREAVEKLWRKLPQVPQDSPAIGWNHHSEVVPRRRWNADLQRFENLCWIAVPVEQSDPLDGKPALAKCLRRIGLEAVKTDHLDRSPRPYRLTLKRRWVPFG